MENGGEEGKERGVEAGWAIDGYRRSSYKKYTGDE